MPGELDHDGFHGVVRDRLVRVTSGNDPNVSASAELDVRLMDGAGKEAWRGPYIGPHEKDVGKPV